MSSSPVTPLRARGLATLWRLSGAETGLLLGAAALLALALCGPVLPASAHQHDFADQRTLWGIPCALDVLSNLAFALAGAWGWWVLRRVPPAALDVTSRALAALFFGGLLCTAAGSALYHWQPEDAGLLWDRLGMVLPFAGLLGLAAASRVSARAGVAAAGAVLLAGPLAVWAWVHTGNLLPWAVVQLGGLLVVLALACLPRPVDGLALHRGVVVLLYALAKLLEAADHSVSERVYDLFRPRKDRKHVLRGHGRMGVGPQPQTCAGGVRRLAGADGTGGAGGFAPQ